ncbi:hypothetical protein [Saccharospirillum mangrovi]|uniref:hypothetical protein n=1 Tax=Saccharospirillum mangrovi TaxID=2161747 RepID=UPI000D3680B5|nr:hypothetical protein [Saccharospirillum mangrovi]
MSVQVLLDCFGEIVEGNHYRGFCHISRDELEDGFFVMVYRDADPHAEVLLSEWFPSMQAVNHFVRDQSWVVYWQDKAHPL